MLSSEWLLLMLNTRLPFSKNNVMFIHLDEDNQDIPSLRSVNLYSVYIEFTEKYESCRGEICEKFHARR